MCVCVSMYVRMYICMIVCNHVCKYACMYACIYACIHPSIHPSINPSVYIYFKKRKNYNKTFACRNTVFIVVLLSRGHYLRRGNACAYTFLSLFSCFLSFFLSCFVCFFLSSISLLPNVLADITRFVLYYRSTYTGYPSVLTVSLNNLNQQKRVYHIHNTLLKERI